MTCVFVRSVSSVKSLGGLGGIRSSSNKSFNLCAVVGISNENWEVCSHFSLVELVCAIKLFPELFFKGLCTVVVELDCVKSHGLKNLHGCLETFVAT